MSLAQPRKIRKVPRATGLFVTGLEGLTKADLEGDLGEKAGRREGLAEGTASIHYMDQDHYPSTQQGTEQIILRLGIGMVLNLYH